MEGFEFFDENHNGKLDYEEFAEFLRCWMNWRAKQENVPASQLLEKDVPLFHKLVGESFAKALEEDQNSQLSRTVCANDLVKIAQQNHLSYEEKLAYVSKAIHLLSDTTDSGVIEEDEWHNLIARLQTVKTSFVKEISFN